jgi:flagellar hook-basal body complex protein FliE
METTARAAAGAYQSLARLSEGLSGRGRPGAAATEEGGADFAGMVRSAVTSIAERGQQTEQTAQAFANGRADLVDVVTAVAETETALETLVSVRDRMIQAYEEIMRMPM